MGMDVFGRNPTTETGTYFRASVWHWRPLWEYCCTVWPALSEYVPDGQLNNGTGLTAAQASELASRLQVSLTNGTADAAIARHHHLLTLVQPVPCPICSDPAPYLAGLDLELPEGVAVQSLIQYQRGHPDSSFSFGIGLAPPAPCTPGHTVVPLAGQYVLDRQTLQEFAVFCAASGGFTIC